MGEFVEQSLEELLPVFEQLEQAQLFQNGEVRLFIKRCRRYEYRLHKQTKRAEDFVIYAEYVTEVLRLIRKRRKSFKYFHKKIEIDGALRNKVEALYRRCTMRFQDRIDIWTKRIAFLKLFGMRNTCSRVYSRLLQVHGNNVKLWQEAASWEFFKNQSAENARRLLQLALRHFPTDPGLWLTLFNIEINYVKRLKDRQDILRDVKTKEIVMNNDEEEPTIIGGTHASEEAEHVPEEVLQLKLVEIVVDQALLSVGEEKNAEMLFSFWRSACDCGPIANRLQKRLFKRLWTENAESEEAWLAKIERKLKKNITDDNANDDPYASYEEAVDCLPTERMIRLYVEFCDQHATNDPFATLKLSNALKLLRDKGFADLNDYKRLLTIVADASIEREQTLELAVKNYPESVECWIEFIRAKIANSNEDRKSIKSLFNRAEKAVPEIDSLPIYQLAVDWTIATCPEKVFKLFERTFHLSPVVSSVMKSSYLRYIANTNVRDYRTEYRRLAKMRPTSVSFHECFLEIAATTKNIDRKLINEAHENAISEFGHLADVWLNYCRYAMNEAVESVSSIYQRAVMHLGDDEAGKFQLKWSRMLQNNE